MSTRGTTIEVSTGKSSVMKRQMHQKPLAQPPAEDSSDSAANHSATTSLHSNTTAHKPNSRASKWVRTCSACKAVLNSQAELQQHVVVHCSVRSVDSCSQCEDAEPCSDRTQSTSEHYLCGVCDPGVTFCTSDDHFGHFVTSHVDGAQKRTQGKKRILASYKSLLAAQVFTGSVFFKCSMCCGRFRSKEGLLKHARARHCVVHERDCCICDMNDTTQACKHPCQTFGCKVCAPAVKPFASLFDYSQHVADFHVQEIDAVSPGGESFKCRTCDVSFQSDYEAFTHLFTHCNYSAFQCRDCGRELASPRAYKTHLNTNTNGAQRHCRNKIPKENESIINEPFCCKICERDFDTRRRFLDHMRQLHVPRSGLGKMWFCKDCDKLFTTVESLRPCRHRCGQAAAGHRAFQCDICKKIYARDLHLQQHMLRAHSDSKDMQFPCEACDKMFSSKDHVRIHFFNIHQDNTVYDCPQCSRSVIGRKRLNYHIRRFHTYKLQALLPCPRCPSTFSRAADFNTHVKYKHSSSKYCAEFKCHLCFKTLSSKKSLESHLETHDERKRTHQCDVCGKCFMSKGSLILHKRSHQGKKFMCEICSMSFKFKHHLSAHMLKHSGVRAFKCTVCEKSFGRKQILDTHMLSHTGVRAFYCDKCKKDFLRKTDLNRHRRKFHPEMEQQLNSRE